MKIRIITFNSNSNRGLSVNYMKKMKHGTDLQIDLHALS